MDYEKLAGLANIKKKSAGQMWGRARQKLEKAVDAEEENAEQNTPTKPKRATKRRKKDPTPEPEPDYEEEEQDISEHDVKPEALMTPEANISGIKDEPST